MHRTETKKGSQNKYTLTVESQVPIKSATKSKGKHSRQGAKRYYAKQLPLPTRNIIRTHLNVAKPGIKVDIYLIFVQNASKLIF